jgi:hypothetical protein
MRDVVRVPRRLFQRLLSERPTPERCVEARYVQRTRGREHRRTEAAPEAVTENGNVEISGRDLDWCNKRSLDFQRPKAGLQPPIRTFTCGYEIETPARAGQ